MTDAKKPALDEQTFEKLLEAAYVLQEHNRKMREIEETLESQSEQLREQELAHQALLAQSKPPSEESERAKADYTLTLAQIVEAQHQIQMRHLELDKAMAVVAERVTRITAASGAGIGLLEGATVHYRAGSGSSALPFGTEVPLQTAVCQANIRTGQVIRTQDVNTEFLYDPDPCLKRGIYSLVAVPIHYDGNIVGALELYFDRPQGFAEQDIHTCQLMAGLVTEAIGRDAELKVRKSMVAERSTMLETIERLKPSLIALADKTAATETTRPAVTSTAMKTPCWKCGNNLLAEEQFCGKCGASRNSESEPPSMQSKLATAWNQQQQNARGSVAGVPADEAALAEDARLFGSGGDDLDEAVHLQAAAEAEEFAGEENAEEVSTAIVKSDSEEIVWSSAAKARDFLESLSPTRTPGALARFWRSRRGDFYLALALVLVVVVVRWGIWSEHSVGASGHGTVSGAARKRPAPDADLSAFDKLLIGLGLAEAPDEAPQYKGNPDTQVWIDLHTALYYCPASDLYGKTAKGRMSSQRDAQLDQFEPANRRACD